MLSEFAEKKETCFDYKKQNFFKVQKIRPAKGVNPCFWLKKCHFLSLLSFGQNKTRNNAFLICREKKPFLTLKNKTFQNPKNRLFFQGVNPCFWSKKAFFFPYLDLIIKKD